MLRNTLELECSANNTMTVKTAIELKNDFNIKEGCPEERRLLCPVS
jgi:hypothetical protein